MVNAMSALTVEKSERARQREERRQERDALRLEYTLDQWAAFLELRKLGFFATPGALGTKRAIFKGYPSRIVQDKTFRENVFEKGNPLLMVVGSTRLPFNNRLSVLDVDREVEPNFLVQKHTPLAQLLSQTLGHYHALYSDTEERINRPFDWNGVSGDVRSRGGALIKVLPHNLIPILEMYLKILDNRDLLTECQFPAEVTNVQIAPAEMVSPHKARLSKESVISSADRQSNPFPGGRNNFIFDTVRAEMYQLNKLDFTYDEWLTRSNLLGVAASQRIANWTGFSHKEVKKTCKSVADWTWYHYHPKSMSKEQFSELQRDRVNIRWEKERARKNLIKGCFV